MRGDGGEKTGARRPFQRVRVEMTANFPNQLWKKKQKQCGGGRETRAFQFSKKKNTLIRPSATFSLKGEGDLLRFRALSPSPLGEKVPEGRMRGPSRRPPARIELP